MLARVSARPPSYEAFGFLGSGGLGRVYRGVHHLCIEARIQELLVRGDRWRVTSLRLLAAFACADSRDSERARPAVAAFLRAFADCPHEKLMTLWMLRELPPRLEALGLSDEARAVRAAEQELRANIDRGFAEPAEEPS